MEEFPKKLHKKLLDRQESNSFRKLPTQNDLIDFASNDYLGFAGSKKIYDQTLVHLKQKNIFQNGSTGSRLLSGNHALYVQTEEQLASFHNSEAAVIFNSGYDANIGFFSSVPQRGDIILYDELIHASIRDGIRMSNAKSYKFEHNNLEDLKKKLQNARTPDTSHTDLVEVYIVTESVFSMDGDTPDLPALTDVCEQYNCHLVVDEAHAVGVFGKNGVGLLQHLNLENKVFARINTFGKALGCHGAVILGSDQLKNYLVNFARSLIYSTGLPPHAVATIQASYKELTSTAEIQKLHKNIRLFNEKVQTTNLERFFIKSDSAIHCCIISGNKRVKQVAAAIQKKGFDVKPILSPTVPKGKERLRFCLHSFNTSQEIKSVVSLLSGYISDYDNPS